MMAKYLISLILFFLISWSRPALARTIDSISPPTGPGLGDSFCLQVQTSVDTPSPNQTGNQITNFPGLSCTPIAFRAKAEVNTTIILSPSEGTTQYLFTQTVINQTEEPWESFTMSIVAADEENNATFEDDPQPTSSTFSQVVMESSRLEWSGGILFPGESAEFSFSLAFPDHPNGQNSLIIRQLPAIL